jgi:hypothetical protein
MSRSLSEHEPEKLAAKIAGLQSLHIEQLKGRTSAYPTNPGFSVFCLRSEF